MDPTLIFAIVIALMVVLLVAGVSQSRRGRANRANPNRVFPETFVNTSQAEQHTHHHHHQPQHHTTPPVQHMPQHHMAPPVHHTPPPSPPPPMHHG